MRTPKLSSILLVGLIQLCIHVGPKTIYFCKYLFKQIFIPMSMFCLKSKYHKRLGALWFMMGIKE